MLATRFCISIFIGQSLRLLGRSCQRSVLGSTSLLLRCPLTVGVCSIMSWPSLAYCCFASNGGVFVHFLTVCMRNPGHLSSCLRQTAALCFEMRRTRPKLTFPLLRGQSCVRQWALWPCAGLRRYSRPLSRSWPCSLLAPAKMLILSSVGRDSFSSDLTKHPNKSAAQE